MDLKELIKDLVDSKADGKPICILEKHPELQSIKDLADKENTELKDQLLAVSMPITLKIDECHKKFWTAFEAKLVELGIISQEDLDKEPQLQFRDGVIYMSPKKSYHKF